MAHPDGARWNERYRRSEPGFTPSPLVSQAAEAGLPDGPVLELACGPSGNALALAAMGRRVVAVDVSDVALEQLDGEVRRRGLGELVECVLADVPAYRPAGRFALVLATLYWDAAAFETACAAVSPCGLLGWEALADTGDDRPFRVPHGELGSRLPEDFTIVSEDLITDRPSTRLLARNTCGT